LAVADSFEDNETDNEDDEAETKEADENCAA